MAAEEVDEILLANGLYLARLDGFGGNFVGHVGKHRAESHHITRPGNFEDHGLAIAGGGGDLDLAVADDENVASGVSLGE